MNKKQLIKQLWWLFVAAMLDAVLVVVLGETNVLPNGIYASGVDLNMEFTLTTSAILLVIASVPLMVWWGNKHLEMRPADSSDEQALKHYYKWSVLRLLVWDFVLVACAVVYYLTMSSTGMLCAAIMLLVMIVYCVPNEEKVALYMGDVTEEIENIEEAYNKEEYLKDMSEKKA